MITTISKDSIYDIFMFFLIFLTGSLYAQEELTGTICFILLIVACALLMLLHKSLYLDKRAIILYIILTFLVIISVSINGVYFDLDIGGILYLTISLIICSMMPWKVFVKHYCRVMHFVSITSIFGMVLTLLRPSFLYQFPTLISHGGIASHNLIFTVIPYTMGNYIRNWSFFREPGYFAVFLVLSICFELLCYQKRNYRMLVIEIIALVLTASTAGYIALALSLGVLVLTENQEVRKKRFYIVLLVVISAGLIYYFTQTEQGLIMYSRIFGKLSGGWENNSSAFKRADGLISALNWFFQSPIVGNGYQRFVGYELDATMVNWFALYGIFYGGICNYLFLSFATMLSAQPIVKIVVALIFCSIVFSQAMDTAPIIQILLFYRITNRKQEDYIEYEKNGEKTLTKNVN